MTDPTGSGRNPLGCTVPTWSMNAKPRPAFTWGERGGRAHPGPTRPTRRSRSVGRGAARPSGVGIRAWRRAGRLHAGWRCVGSAGPSGLDRDDPGHIVEPPHHLSTSPADRGSNHRPRPVGGRGRRRSKGRVQASHQIEQVGQLMNLPRVAVVLVLLQPEAGLTDGRCGLEGRFEGPLDAAERIVGVRRCAVEGERHDVGPRPPEGVERSDREPGRHRRRERHVQAGGGAVGDEVDEVLPARTGRHRSARPWAEVARRRPGRRAGPCPPRCSAPVGHGTASRRPGSPRRQGRMPGSLPDHDEGPLGNIVEGAYGVAHPTTTAVRSRCTASEAAARCPEEMHAAGPTPS